MRILDRYVVRQLLPVWLWCLLVFIFLSCLIDLFGRLDEILRHHIPPETVWHLYRSFIPIVFVRSCPVALLIASAFIGSRLARHQELLAMHASGTSLLRASLPFLFVGWLAAIAVFAVSELVLPRAAGVYEQLKEEAFYQRRPDDAVENVAVIDDQNRLYHARELNPKVLELRDLTVLEHDLNNRPTRNLYASRAIWTPHGWLLLHGTIYRVGPDGLLRGNPLPYTERLMEFPVTPASFLEPAARPETMSFGSLRELLSRLKHLGIRNVRSYSVELVAKTTVPIVNLVICLIGFAGATQPQLRGHLRGLGTSLGWGTAYYIGVGVFHGIAKQWPLPAILVLWAPHVLAARWCVKKLQAAR